MMNTDEPTGPGPATDPAAAPPTPPPPFTMAELMSMAQHGVPPENAQRLLFTCFHFSGVIQGKDRAMETLGGQHKLMMDAIGCLCKLNGGTLRVGLNVKKTISPKAAFDFTYDKKLNEAVFVLREPRGGIVIASEIPKKPKGG